MGNVFKRDSAGLRELVIPEGMLHTILPILPSDTRVALDTETSGLYVDGDWHTQAGKCSPPARVSIVSLAWINDEGELESLTIPFDQGRVEGKPGAYSHTKRAFEPIKPWCACGLAFEKHARLPKSKQHEYMPDHPTHNFNQTDWHSLTAWLATKVLVMHNAKFDCHIMTAGLRLGGSGIDLMSKVVWDTQIFNGLTEPLQSSSLKPTMKRLFGEDEGDEQQAVLEALKKNGTGLTKRYDLVPWYIIGPYAAKDAEQTIRLAHYHWQMIDEGAITSDDTRIYHEQELPLVKLLYLMEQRGVGFDSEGMRDEAKRMLDAVRQLEEQLPFKPANINGAKQYFFGMLNIPPVKVTDGGGDCLDAEVVARLVADNVPGASQWQDLADLKSALGKWYERWPYLTGTDGRLRTNFRQGRTESDRPGAKAGGAISGRLSAERVQLQGVPKEYNLPKSIKPVKKFVKSKARHGVWELDQSNAEVRVAAWLSRCKKLAEVINSGVNIHDGNTRMMFGIEPDHPQWEMYRTICKTSIFGDLYGAGVRTLKGQIEKALKQQGIMEDFSEAKIKYFKDMLNDAYPELRATSIACQRKADRSMGGCGYVRLVNGRKRRFGWAERTHKAFNACIQGGVAEVMKMWMLEVEHCWPGVLINQVHDSIWLEVPAEHTEVVVTSVKLLGEAIFSQNFSTPSNPIKFQVDAKRIAADDD